MGNRRFDQVFVEPPERMQATRHNLRTIMAKPGWSSRELKAVRGIIRALVNPRPKD